MHSCRQKKVGFADFNKFLEDIATTKKMDLNEFKQKLTDCGDPGTKGATVRPGDGLNKRSHGKGRGWPEQKEPR